MARELSGFGRLSDSADRAIHPIAKENAYKCVDQDPEGIVGTVSSRKDKNQEPKQLVRNP
ncbi:MAG: hypothetical protein H6Q00_3243 [Holophagaceae bacterium]|nr:hypothetical protein [Holophagaceae bacterium]